MGDCPITFSTAVPLLPRMIPASTLWSYIDPDMTLTLTFGETMDQTVVPVPADFVLTVDDVVKVPSDVHWTGATTCVLDYSEVALAPNDVHLRFSTKTPLFLSILDELVTPFDLFITPA